MSSVDSISEEMRVILVKMKPVYSGYIYTIVAIVIYWNTGVFVPVVGEFEKIV